jgi:hypothetical protein
MSDADGLAAMPPKGTQKDVKKDPPKGTQKLDAFFNTEAGLTITLEQAMIFDEGTLNSWLEEQKVPIIKRAEVLQNIRAFKKNCSHQSTEALEDELTSKMLFDSLLFVVAFTIPTGVTTEEMHAAWNADVAAYAAQNKNLNHLGSYEEILIVLTYVVTTSTGIALIVGYSIYTCLRHERPSDILEAEMFYARFKLAYRFSYFFTYSAILLLPFACYELHMVKIRDIPNRQFITNYSWFMYGMLLSFLAGSLWNDHYWRKALRKKRGLPWDDSYSSICSWICNGIRGICYGFYYGPESDVLKEVTRKQRSASLRQLLASGFRVKRENRTKSSAKAMKTAEVKGMLRLVPKEARQKKTKAAMKPGVASNNMIAMEKEGSSSRHLSDRSQADTSDIAPKTASPPHTPLTSEPAVPRPTPNPGRARPLAA